jgi:phosphate acetyltransferase
MSAFIDGLKQKAASAKKIIVFPESTDQRVLKAVQMLQEQNLVTPILIGSQPQIAQAAQQAGANVQNIQIHDPGHDIDYQNFVQQLVQLRKEKGMTQEEAQKLMLDPVYFGTMMVKTGKAHGLVSGAAHSTADTLRPALQLIKTSNVKIASSFFFMVFEDGRLFLFSDCGVNINPTAEQLAEITKSTVHSAQQFGIQPNVALLSFSTKGSAKDPLSDKVVQATQFAQQMNLGVPLDGELQLDAAIVPEIAQSKAKDSPVKGNANVLIFPDLNAGNIGYKLTERLAGAHALGPIMQGLAMPVNDLSRGCSVDDIVDVACITAIQATAVSQAAPAQKQPLPPQQTPSLQAISPQSQESQLQPPAGTDDMMASLRKLKEDSLHVEETNGTASPEQPAEQPQGQ